MQLESKLLPAALQANRAAHTFSPFACPAGRRFTPRYLNIYRRYRTLENKHSFLIKCFLGSVVFDFVFILVAQIVETQTVFFRINNIQKLRF